MFVLTLPALFITIAGKSIAVFSQPWCEALNNMFLTEYKLILSVATLIFIIVVGIKAYKKGDNGKRRQVAIVGSALVLFFAVFSITEFISSQTGIYEINLYSLFILPLFLALIIYAITNLEIFRVRFIATQILVYVTLILIGSQFFFLQNTTDRILTVITFILSLVFSIFLI